MDGTSPLKRQVLVVTYAVALVSVLALLFYARSVFLVCLIGIGIGVLITPPLDFFERRFRIPRGLSALLLLAGLATVITGLGYGIFLLAAEQATALAAQAPAILSRVESMLVGPLQRFPWIADQISNFSLGNTLSSAGVYLLGGLISVFAAISGLVIALVLGMYVAVGAKMYFGIVQRAFPPHARPKAASFLGECAAVLRKWFRAQLLDMLIVGILTAAGLWIVGMPYWAVFGLLAAIFGIIPYVGMFLVVFLAGIVTLAVEPGNLPWVVLVFIVTQQIESHVVLPLVMKGGADLPAVPLLISMLLLGSWLGLLGAFLAPPLFAISRVAYKTFYQPWVTRDRSTLPNATR